MTDGGRQSAIADVWAHHPAAKEVVSVPGLARRNADYICRTLQGVGYNPNPSQVPLRPVMLSAPVRSNLDSASRYLVELIHRVCWSLSDDPAVLARHVGLREEQVPLLGACGSRHEIDYSACNGRLDALLVNSNPIFLEANFSAANVDSVVTHYLLAAYRTLYGLTPKIDATSAGEPFEARVHLYRKIFREHQASHSVAIVAKREPNIGNERYYEAEPSYLRARGIESDLVEPSYFGAAQGNKKYSIAQKHFLSEYWMALNISLGDMAAAHADTVFLVPDSGRALSSKLVFAWLSAGSIPLSPSERSFVNNHIPWTRHTERGDDEFDGRTWNLRELALDKQENFVLKPLTCCGGKGVLLGRNTAVETWRQHLDDAIELADSVLQQYVDADELAMDCFDRETGLIQSVNVTYVLGSYIVDGINAGSTVRHFLDNAPGVVNLNTGASFNIVL